MKRIAIVVVAQTLCAFSAWGQENRFNPNQTVVPITDVKPVIGLGVGVKFNFGTGFCVDVKCRFIGTNYHVAIWSGASLKIRGERATRRYLDSGPDDEDATLNEDLDPKMPSMKFNVSRDLALYELKRPLADKGFHGITFNLEELQQNQEVDIYAYPLTGQFQVKRSIVKFSGRFIGTTQYDLLAFSYEPSAQGQVLKSGASGGLVVDRATQQVVGIFNGVSKSANIATAVSVQKLASFLKKVTPELYAEIFPPTKPGESLSTEKILADAYPRFIPVPSHSDGLQLGQEESANIKLLRKKAQGLAESIQNFIALQTTFYGGMSRPPAPMQYEIRVVDGEQRFRTYPDGTTEIKRPSFPRGTNPILGASSEWADLAARVGTQIKLRMVEAKDITMGERRMKVFQYYGAVEDDVCGFEDIDDYVLFSRSKVFTVSCSGEVWTDENFNIIRISEQRDLPPQAQWTNFRTVANYGWFEGPDRSTILVPLSVVNQAMLKGSVYWCRELFTKYRVFTTRSRFLQTNAREANQGTDAAESLPQK